MENIIISICILSFIALFATVVYFRIKVLRSYSKLLDNKIEFEIKHVFNKNLLEKEIIPKYSNHQKLIREFTFGIRLSTQMVTVFMIIITLCAGILMYYR